MFKEYICKVAIFYHSCLSYTDQSSLLDGITTVTLSMDEYVVCQNIMFDDDIKYEESEVLSLSLFVSGEQNSAVEISPDTATIYIIDDDGKTLSSKSLHV